MARIKLDPSLAYSDVIPLWETALSHQGARYDARDAADAARVHARLNEYRRRIRENGTQPHDMFIVKRRGLVLTIEPVGSLLGTITAGLPAQLGAD